MRYLLLSSPAVLADDVRFSESHVDEVVKKFTLTLWNTYTFFVTYSNIDKWEPKKTILNFNPKNQLDKWILSELNSLIKEVTTQMNDYNLAKAIRPTMDFLDNLSNWYVRRCRRRFWKSENDGDKNQAYSTLYFLKMRRAIRKSNSKYDGMDSGDVSIMRCVAFLMIADASSKSETCTIRPFTSMRSALVVM